MSDRDRILRRVRALLRLSRGRGATPGEAAAAAARAQALLLEHDLALAEVEAEPEDDAVVDSRTLDEPPLGRLGERWFEVLVEGVSRLHGCYAYASNRRYTPLRPMTVEIAGRKLDIAATRYVVAFLRRETNRLARENTFGFPASHRLAYKLGAVEAMLATLRRERARLADELRASAGSAAALVTVAETLAGARNRHELARQQVAEALTGEPYTNPRASKPSTLNEYLARLAGQVDGAAVNVSSAGPALRAPATRIEGRAR